MCPRKGLDTVYLSWSPARFTLTLNFSMEVKVILTEMSVCRCALLRDSLRGGCVVCPFEHFYPSRLRLHSELL